MMYALLRVADQMAYNKEKVQNKARPRQNDERTEYNAKKAPPYVV